MSRVVVFENVTLDGVAQAPGRPDEDRRGGFAHGGWVLPYNDPVMGSVAGQSMARVAYQDCCKSGGVAPAVSVYYATLLTVCFG